MYYSRRYLIYLYLFGGLSILLGLKMVVSAFTPLDSYTKRLRGPEPLWGRALGLLLAPVFILAGAGMIWIAWQGEPWSTH